VNQIRLWFLMLIANAFLMLECQSVATAALTYIHDALDQLDEPNLIGTNPFPGNLNPSVLETLYGESNLRRVDDSADIAFKHTGTQATVRAVAQFSDIVRLLNYSTSAGTWQNVVQIFGFNQGYNPQFGAAPIFRSISGPVFILQAEHDSVSDPRKNYGKTDMMVTFEIIGTSGHPNNHVGNYITAWECFFGTDDDYQDLVFELGGAVPVPEPGTGSLALVGLFSLALFRRRCSGKTYR
jgi:hypothetical protein